MRLNRLRRNLTKIDLLFSTVFVIEISVFVHLIGSGITFWNMSLGQMKLNFLCADHRVTVYDSHKHPTTTATRQTAAAATVDSDSVSGSDTSGDDDDDSDDDNEHQQKRRQAMIFKLMNL